MKTIIILIAVIVIAEPIISILLRKHINDKLFICLKNQDLNTFNTIINAKLTKFLFKPFNIEYSKLNMYLILNDTKNIDIQFKKLTDMPLTQKQKEDLYLKAFNYYLSIENQKLTDKYYSLCKSLNNYNIAKTADISYDTFCKKGYKYLNETLELYKQKNSDFSLEYLLSQMYANKGDDKQSAYYKSLYDSHLN